MKGRGNVVRRSWKPSRSAQRQGENAVIIRLNKSGTIYIMELMQGLRK